MAPQPTFCSSAQGYRFAVLRVISSQPQACLPANGLRSIAVLLILAWGVEGCRCEAEPGASPPSSCLAVCQDRGRCGEDPAQCAAECSRLRLLVGAEAQASQLLTCVAQHGCATDLRYGTSPPGDACADQKSALRARLLECRAGDALHRVIPGGSIQIESLGCIELNECQAVLDAGAPGSRCQSASVCRGHCCAECQVDERLGQRSPVARVRACINQRCASEAEACAALSRLRPCKGTGR